MTAPASTAYPACETMPDCRCETELRLKGSRFSHPEHHSGRYLARARAGFRGFAAIRRCFDSAEAAQTWAAKAGDTFVEDRGPGRREVSR